MGTELKKLDLGIRCLKITEGIGKNSYFYEMRKRKSNKRNAAFIGSSIGE